MLAWVARRSKRADGKERGRRIPAVGCNDRATPPAALLPRAGNGCVDFGVIGRCSLGRHPQQRDPLQYFITLLGRFCFNSLQNDVFSTFLVTALKQKSYRQMI